MEWYVRLRAGSAAAAKPKTRSAEVGLPITSNNVQGQHTQLPEGGTPVTGFCALSGGKRFRDQPPLREIRLHASEG